MLREYIYILFNYLLLYLFLYNCKVLSHENDYSFYVAEQYPGFKGNCSLRTTEPWNSFRNLQLCAKSCMFKDGCFGVNWNEELRQCANVLNSTDANDFADYIGRFIVSIFYLLDNDSYFLCGILGLFFARYVEHSHIT